MNKFRFIIDGQPTEWEIEHVRCGPEVHTAVARITELRRQYPHAAIGIQREGEPAPERPQMFRYDVLVRDAVVPVIERDEKTGMESIKTVKIHNQPLQTRPFYEREREKVLAELNQRFPDAQLMEVKVNGRH